MSGLGNYDVWKLRSPDDERHDEEPPVEGDELQLVYEELEDLRLQHTALHKWRERAVELLQYVLTNNPTHPAWPADHREAVRTLLKETGDDLLF